MTKPCDRHTLARAIAETMAGGHPIASDMTAAPDAGAALHPPKRGRRDHPELTARENEMLRWLAEGWRTRRSPKRWT